MKKQNVSREAVDRAKSITLDQIVAEPAISRGDQEAAAVDTPLSTVSIGRIVATHQAAPLVDFPSNTSGELVPARSLVPVSEKEIGREVALAFEDNDPAKPLILGMLQDGDRQSPDCAEVSSTPLPVAVKVDEDVLTLSAKKEIVLRCGKASITLTSAGKLLIHGEYVVSRSSGVNKIRGGSVQIN
jgi:hypothetical protein